MRWQLKIPLHLPQQATKEDALDRLSHLANMSSLNPKGFRTASEKRNRRRIKTRAEQLSELHDAA